MEAEAGPPEDGGLAPRMEDRTLVQFLDLRCSPGPCGYCHGTGSISQGMLVERMSVDDYQALLNRGWRRSGRYVYKPLMETTCCPLYTIRCQAEKFEPSKSQRKVVRRFNNFLLGGKEKETESITSRKEKEDKTVEDMLMDTRENLGSEMNKLKRVEGLKKKKIFRKERKLEKMLKSNCDGKASEKPSLPKNRPKTLSDLLPTNNYMRLNETLDQEVKPGSQHKFSLRLVRANLRDPNFMATFQESYSVYQQYQLIVHKDPPHDCDMQSFAQFLCNSPLMYETRQGVELGAFHQHYLVDGRIVAVAVLDILPQCLSSVYLYYDPKFWGSKLSPGTYSAIREIQLTQELGKQLPSLQYYYLGYYVHSCPKMKYKGQFLPSQLLSPSLLSWHPITSCLPLLDSSKYCTFEGIDEMCPGPTVPPSEIGRVGLLAGNVATCWAKVGGDRDDPVPQRLSVYWRLVGQTLAESMLLYWETGGEDTETDSDSE